MNQYFFPIIMKNEQRRRYSYMNRLRSDTSNDTNPIIEACVPGRLATFFKAKKSK